MGKKNKNYKRNNTRADPGVKQNSQVAFCSLNDWDNILYSGYTTLDKNPEIVAAVNQIADLVSGMPIHLMENTENGDQRVKDELARKVDISPNDFMTRKTLISVVVRNLFIEGDGNSVIFPQTEGGYLKNLFPLPPSSVSFVSDGFGYRILYNGKDYSPNDFIHIVINPHGDYPWKGTGYRTVLSDVLKNLKQANATNRSFMESKWKPSVIVKVDGSTEEFASPEGRKKLLGKYIESTEAGEPWMIPADQFEIETVTPLSLKDLAINDAVTLDKRTAAAVINVPPFILGVGDFKKEEWNNFVNTKIKNICIAIEQGFTKGLLTSPNRYFKLNNRSLFAYDIKTINDVCESMTRSMAMRRNEWRDWLGISPDEEMNELLALENYVPADRLGDQKKLKGGGDEGGKEDD